MFTSVNTTRAWEAVKKRNPDLAPSDFFSFLDFKKILKVSS